jgi:hypothetical protein
VPKGLRDRRRLFAPGFSDIDAGSAARVSEAAVSRCGFAVMTRLGHGLQAVPRVEQDLVAIVRRPVIDDDSRPPAAGAVVLLALTKRVAGKIRQAKPLPAAPIDP